MIYKSISSGNARIILDARSRGESVELEQSEETLGSGSPITDENIEAVVSKVNQVRSSYPDVLTVADRSRFDAEASVAIHQTLEIDQVVAGDPGFWTWLAVAHFGDVIEWRYYREQGAHYNNYGIGSRWRNLPARLWFQSDICYDDQAGDPYHLSKLGDTDFYESGIIRHRYSSCRNFARALVRYQYPGDDSNNRTLTPIRRIRALYVKLRRIQPNLQFEAMDDDACLELISDIAQSV